MKVLTATTRTQGQGRGDFCFAIEGELVYLDIVCASDKDDPHGRCGCGRAFSGLNSHKGSTTALVCDLDLTKDDLLDAAGSSLERMGLSRAHADELASEIMGLAYVFPVGAVLERRLSEVRIRERARLPDAEMPRASPSG